MHPAPSIVFFTTASGAGYGLLALLGVGGALGLLPAERAFGLAALALALGLVSAGLVSSTFHLGRPERAWRALSQWRSSWLSREGALALATYPPALVLAFGWIVVGRTTGGWAVWGLLAALAALATVACTAMIYASLKPVRQWHSRWVPLAYLGFALATGAVWLNALTVTFGAGEQVWRVMAILLIIAAWLIKGAQWRETAAAAPLATAASATGLDAFGPVRLLDPPHQVPNYLMREMGFVVARRHADRLRRLAVVSGGVVPVALVPVAGQLPVGWGTAAALLAALAGSLGVLIERWLFFAEAQHTVTLYYGAEAV